MLASTLSDFYQTNFPEMHTEPGQLLPDGIRQSLGHFNVFSVAELIARADGKPPMPCNWRTYYKISPIIGRNTAAYADREFEIEDYALLFATPKIPYHYVPTDLDQRGHFCIFTEEFLQPAAGSTALDNLPLFQPGAYPVFKVSRAEKDMLLAIFTKMHAEMASAYAYKYDLLRAYLIELIHRGQKLQPAAAQYPAHNAAARVSSLFIELLERQFPIEGPGQQLHLRTAADFAARLSVHVNHLNKALKESTGTTTTALISRRVAREAKILLKQTAWTVSEIAYCLGFEEVAHFSNFFRKQAGVSPLAFRAVPAAV